MKHMIKNSESAVLQEQVDSTADQFLKSQTITPHADDAPVITITKTNNNNNTHALNFAAIVKQNTGDYATTGDVTKRKATSPLQSAPSNKIQKMHGNNNPTPSDASRLHATRQKEQLTSITNNNNDVSGNGSNTGIEESKIEGYKVNELISEPNLKKVN